MPRLMHQVRAIPGELANLPKAVKGISAVIFLYYLGWALFEPFLPIYFTEVLGSYSSATFVVAILYLFGVLWSFPVGEFVDRFSKRKWIRIILLLYIPLWPWLALVQTVGQFIVFRVYHSFLATNLWGASDSYLRSHSPDRHQSESVGLYDFGISFAMVIGAVIGGALLLFLDIRVIIVTIPVVLVVIAYMVARYIPETPRTLSLQASLKSIDWRHLYRKELRDSWSRPALRSILMFSFILGILGIPQMTLLPLLSNSIGASSLATGFMYALFIAPLMLEAPFSVLADRWSRRALLVVGSSLAALAFIGLSATQLPIFLFPLVLLLGSSIAMIKPVISGVATAAMPKKHVGEMNAVYTASSSLGGFLALLALGPLADTMGIHIPFLISGLIMIVFLGLVVFLWPGVESRLKDDKKMAL